MKFKPTQKQWRAVAKRVADTSEKLAVGALLYWLFHTDDQSGLWFTLEFFAASIFITLYEAREWTESQSTASSGR